MWRLFGPEGKAAGKIREYIWGMVSAFAAFFLIDPSRSKEAFLKLIGNWHGILVSDDYALYCTAPGPQSWWGSPLQPIYTMNLTLPQTGTWTGLEYPLLVGGEESLPMARVSFLRSDFRPPGLPRIPGIFEFSKSLSSSGFSACSAAFPSFSFCSDGAPVPSGSAGGLSSRR